MDFWSKGLGKRTIALSLTKGEPLRSEGSLYLRGQMEEPVSWEYIMRLTEDDMVEFFELLKEPALAGYIAASPNRWKIYAGMLRGGVVIGALVVGVLVRRLFGLEAPQEEVILQVPPPTERKRKRPVRRRLGTRTTAAPTLEPVAEEEGSAEALPARARG